MRMRFAVCLAALVAIFGACGGRMIETDGQNDQNATGGSSTHGGKQSSGATTSAGATSSSGGTAVSSGGTGVSFGGTANFSGTSSSAFGGATASGGAIGIAGAASSGGVCGCGPIACPPGFVPVPNADGCCFHCQSVCDQVACPGIACGSGSHLEVVPGQCCPTCVQDNCGKQQSAYQDFRKQLVDKYAYGCMTSNDCTVYYEKNQCGAGCGLAVLASAVNNLDSNLQSYAQQTCSPMCPFPVPPCDARPSPFCYNGRCQ